MKATWLARAVASVLGKGQACVSSRLLPNSNQHSDTRAYQPNKLCWRCATQAPSASRPSTAVMVRLI